MSSFAGAGCDAKALLVNDVTKYETLACSDMPELVFGLFVFLRYSLNFVVPATNIDSLAI